MRSTETWTAIHKSVSGHPYAIVAFFISGAYVAVDLSFIELESLRDKITAHLEQMRDSDLRVDAINNQDLLRDTELMHDITMAIQRDKQDPNWTDWPSGLKEPRDW